MDEMKLKLSTKFMRGIVAKIASKVIRKKFGAKVKLELHEIQVEVIDGEVRIHLNVDGQLSKDEFHKFLEQTTEDEG